MNLFLSQFKLKCLLRFPAYHTFGTLNVFLKSCSQFNKSSLSFVRTNSHVQVRNVTKVCNLNFSLARHPHFTKSRLKCNSCQYRLLQKSWPLLVLSRKFKTSDRRYLHPVVWIVLRPLLKLVAILTGRGVRKWWRTLPSDKKQYFFQWVKEIRSTIAMVLFGLCLVSGTYYWNHLEETPITKRKRFIAFNAKQLEEIQKFELEQVKEQLAPQTLPKHHPATVKVEQLVKRILQANIDIPQIKEKTWDVSVVNNSIKNAFVLPIGHVFVFTGMIEMCSNDDQLGTVLSHEISHCILNHGAENVSFTHLTDLASIVIIAAIWAIFPSDYISLLVHWLYHQMLQILLHLPYNRNIEKEADYVGLKLSAKACFDVRESSAFWSKMAFMQKCYEQAPEIEFLSTHPNHETRSQFLDEMMGEAIQIYNSCQCPKLSPKDPRNNAAELHRFLEFIKREYQNLKPIQGFKM